MRSSHDLSDRILVSGLWRAARRRDL